MSMVCEEDSILNKNLYFYEFLKNYFDANFNKNSRRNNSLLFFI